MPGIFHKPIGRRAFLGCSAKTAAVSLLAAQGVARLSSASAEKPVQVALLSDTHVAADPQNEYRTFLPAENLKQIVPQVIDARPQAVFINGDVARLTGQLEDYQAIEPLLSPLAEQAPIFFGLGNHDHRENFLKVFGTIPDADQKVSGKHVLVWEQPALRVIVLDSLLYVDRVAGLLGKAQREWLDPFLARVDGRPTVFVVHHTLSDGDSDLLDAEALFRIVRPYRKVKAIFYGHSHRYACGQHQGIHLVNLPAVGYNFNDREPVGWVDASFSGEGVDLTLRALAGNRSNDGQTTSLAWRSS